jgi:alcohol sulfotransferase
LLKKDYSPLKAPANKADYPFFQHPLLKYTVSSCHIEPQLGVLEYIRMLYPFIKPNQVSSLYGFTCECSPLYGGRPYSQKHSLRSHHLEEMKQLGIGLSLQLTNHYFEPAAYEASLQLLDNHHQRGNSITCFTDELAQCIRQDFPLYRLKASSIKNWKNKQQIEAAFELYDDVVISMDKNVDTDFLATLPNKKHIILFANTSCTFNCPNRSCYVGFSQQMLGRKVTMDCSIPKYEREPLGKLFFDVAGLTALGFRQLKLVLPYPEKKWTFIKNSYQTHKTWHIFNKAEQKNQLTQIASYPKSGRTWLRYFLAQYLVALKKLDVEVDLATMFSLLPNDSQDAEKGWGAFNTQFRQQIPLIHFTHKLYNDQWVNTKTLLLLRSIPDTLVSEYFHFNHHIQTTKVPIVDYLLKSPNQGVNLLCQYLNGWVLQPTGLHRKIVTYESMMKNPVDSFEEVLTFLDIPIDSNILEQASKASSLKNMSAQESQQTIPGISYDFTNKAARRMRKGNVGGYRQYLSEDTVEEIRQFCSSELTPAAKDMLSQQELWPFGNDLSSMTI